MQRDFEDAGLSGTVSKELFNGFEQNEPEVPEHFSDAEYFNSQEARVHCMEFNDLIPELRNPRQRNKQRRPGPRSGRVRCIELNRYIDELALEDALDEEAEGFAARTRDSGRVDCVELNGLIAELKLFPEDMEPKSSCSRNASDKSSSSGITRITCSDDLAPLTDLEEHSEFR